MGLLTEFNKLHLSAKSVILSLAVLMPFWWVAIYVFNKPLYNTKDFFILVPLCFCFSITWYVFNIGIGLGISAVRKKEGEKPIDLQGHFIVGGIASIGYLSFAIVLSYYFKWSFIVFLIVAYSYIAFRIIGWFFIAMFSKPQKQA